MVGGVVEWRLQVGATVLCQESKGLDCRRKIPRFHHPQQSAKKAIVQYAAVAPFWFVDQGELTWRS